MQPPIVLVDIDGVLADFNAGTFSYVQKSYPDIVKPNYKQFHVHHNFDDAALQASIVAMHSRPGFFRTLPLIDGAVEGWQRIIDLGYHPRICSSPLRSNPASEQEKREWLNEHFGAAVASDAIIDRNKYLHEGIALIDDRTDLYHTDQASWQQILFDAPYNQDVTTDYRLHGWNDPQLGSLLEHIASSR